MKASGQEMQGRATLMKGCRDGRFSYRAQRFLHYVVAFADEEDLRPREDEENAADARKK